VREVLGISFNSWPHFYSQRSVHMRSGINMPVTLGDIPYQLSQVVQGSPVAKLLCIVKPISIYLGISQRVYPVVNIRGIHCLHPVRVDPFNYIAFAWWAVFCTTGTWPVLKAIKMAVHHADLKTIWRICGTKFSDELSDVELTYRPVWRMWSQCPNEIRQVVCFKKG